MKRDLAQPIYGRVKRGGPILGWLLHSLIRGSFLGILSVNGMEYMWHLWLLYPHYLYCLYVGYGYVL